MQIIYDCNINPRKKFYDNFYLKRNVNLFVVQQAGPSNTTASELCPQLSKIWIGTGHHTGHHHTRDLFAVLCCTGSNSNRLELTNFNKSDNNLDIWLTWVNWNLIQIKSYDIGVFKILSYQFAKNLITPVSHQSE